MIELYFSVTGYKTLDAFWRMTPKELFFLAKRVVKKARKQTEQALLADYTEGEE